MNYIQFKKVILQYTIIVSSELPKVLKKVLFLELKKVLLPKKSALESAFFSVFLQKGLNLVLFKVLKKGVS